MVSVIPQVAELVFEEEGRGFGFGFGFGPNTRKLSVYHERIDSALVEVLVGELRAALELRARVEKVEVEAIEFRRDLQETPNNMEKGGQEILPAKYSILLTSILIPSIKAEEVLGEEGYFLQVAPEAIYVRAKNQRGFFYGIQTLIQMLPVDSSTTIPCCIIKDYPRYRWRGLHLDVSRHFKPISFVKKFIDLMALHKFNTFHWHLTDDQGWRIEIKSHPELAEKGSYRKETTGNNTPHFGYYTQDEIVDLVKYASSKFITVIPEIEMPGHSTAVLAAHPELSCTGKPIEVATTWGIFEDVYCAGKEEVFQLVEDVLTEVAQLFPSDYIHVGADECPKNRWQSCSRCQERIKTCGLKDEHELQSYFIRRVEKILESKGKKLVGWDEILEGGLSPNATVMSWRGMNGGIEAALLGHDVVMTPTSHCYFDYYQSEDRSNEPKAIGGLITLEHVYGFDPTPTQLKNEESSKHILGAQGNIWTEYMYNEQIVEYMTYPRACALSEVVWTNESKKNLEDFKKRLTIHLQRLQVRNVNYRKPS